MRQMADYKAVNLIVQTDLVSDAACVVSTRGASADSSRSAARGMAHASTARRQGGVTTTVRSPSARRLRGLRAHPRRVGDLRAGFVQREPANSRDRHSHGARRNVAGPPRSDHVTHAGARRRGYRLRRRCVGAARRSVERPVVRRDVDRSGDVHPVRLRCWASSPPSPATFRLAVRRAWIRASRLRDG